MEEQVKRNFKLMFSRVWVLLLLALAGAAITYFTYARNFEPRYEATARLMIMTSDVNNRTLSVFDSIRSSQMAVGDVSQIITSETVLAGVEKDCGVFWLNLLEDLNINAIPNTRTMEISAQSGSPEQALAIIQSLERNLGIVLKDVDGNITYRILSRPYASTVPVNSAYPVIFICAAAIGGLILGCLINLVLGQGSSKSSPLTQALSSDNQQHLNTDQSTGSENPLQGLGLTPGIRMSKDRFTLPASDTTVQSGKY